MSFSFFFLQPTIAQKIDWKEYVDKTYVFEINNKEALKLVKSNPYDSIILKMLHTPKGSFKGNWDEQPKQGHFIHARINKNRVNFNYEPVIPFRVFLFKEYGALTIQVIDEKGEIRDDAKVELGGSRIDYDKASRTYTFDDYWSEKELRILTVELNKFKAIFNLKKHLVSPWYGGSGSRSGNSPEFYSYMLTDKNKYKPKETVRFKSYALSESKRPIKDELEVWMNIPDQYKYKKITTVTPYNPGGFAGEFTLHDSLKLKLDKTYYVQLRDKRGRIVSSTNFKYEDYELYDSNLKVEISNTMHFRPDTNKVTIKATDVNGLFLLDTKADVTVSRRNVINSYTDVLSLPDILIQKRIDLDPAAPTIFNIPPDIFKESDCAYDVQVKVTTFDNQRLEDGRTATYYYNYKKIIHSTSNDTIRFSYLDLGKEQKIKAELSYNGTTDKKIVDLPYQEKFDQKLQSYFLKIKEPEISTFINTDEVSSKLDLIGGIEKGAFKVKMVNPLNLEVSWYIYQGNILLEKGSGTELDFEYPDTDLGVAHYVELFYFMGDEEEAFKRVFVPKTEYLDIDMDLPDRVYPGQKLDATITVKDHLGKPVSGVDLTAFSVNNMLGYNIPDLPYYGAPPRTREQRSSYSMDEREYDFSMPLNYKYWNKKAQLDQIDYYKFTYPWDILFYHTVDVPDGITQFAPYVMKNGEAIKLYAIEVDDDPVYFSWTEQPQTYSFKAKNTYQKLSLRLHDRVIILDSMLFHSGKKNIISIDVDHLPYKARVIRFSPVDKKYVFKDEELFRFKKYISVLPVRENADNTMLEQYGVIYPIYHACWSPRRSTVIAGPIPQGNATYDGSVEYFHEGGFSYKFSKNVVYKYPEQVCPPSLGFSSSNNFENINDLYLTKSVFLKRVEECRKGRGDWHPNNIYISEQGMSMNFRFPREQEKSGVSNLLFFNKATGKIVFPNRYEHNRRSYSEIPEGVYNIVLLYNNGKYLKKDNVSFSKYTYLDVDMSKLNFHEADSASQKWLLLKSYSAEIGTTKPIYNVNETRYVRKGNKLFSNTVVGQVKDAQGESLIGVSIQIVGTTYGAMTDVDGYFSIEVDDFDTTLRFSYIGFKPQDIKVTARSQVSVTMEEDVKMLEEVVVTGYGTMRKSDLTGSSVMIRGMASGIMISEPPAPQSPPEELGDLPEEKKDEVAGAEDRLYSELMQLSGLRSNFSDVGFWEPRLFTDKKGKVDFAITFPDNITRWDAVVYAMNRKLKTGTLHKSIRSFKPLMAELKTPQFLVVGDSSYFAGVIRNYTKDPLIKGKVMFAIEQDTLMNKNIEFNNAFTEKLLVKATATDSITTRYILTRDDGYTDGEERSISIEPQGTEIAHGTLAFLQNGDKIDVSADVNEKIHIGITGKQLDVYMDATYYLTGYKHACNEQLASKLMGLLNFRVYQQYIDKKFKHDKNVREIIERLEKNRNSKQLWSWWGVSDNTSFWMSSHVMRALKMAKDAGYEVNLNLSKVATDYADITPYRHMSVYDVEVVHALSQWGAKQDYAKAVDMLEKEVSRLEAYDDSMAVVMEKKYRYDKYYKYYKRSYLKEKLLLIEIRQKENIGYASDSLSKYFKKAILGEVYCDDGKNAYSWYSDKLNNTLIAYRIIKNDSTLQHIKEPMQMYILGTKSVGWNTYQASSALATVFPDLLAEAYSKDKPATVLLKGKENKVLTEFPYQAELSAGENLSIEKKDGMPLIYTSYSYKYVTKANSGEAFDVSSSLSNKVLTAGIPATLSVRVNVKQENAEYVMIEVPIPAGCSYASKSTRDYHHEVHREYYKEKTIIFCEKLPVGIYNFTINLLPRYTGSYTLNPAKAELMYFPVINANNDMRKVAIEERKE